MTANKVIPSRIKFAKWPKGWSFPHIGFSKLNSANHWFDTVKKWVDNYYQIEKGKLPLIPPPDSHPKRDIRHGIPWQTGPRPPPWEKQTEGVTSQKLHMAKLEESIRHIDSRRK